MSELLPCVELGPAEGARASIVWLHGLGADGRDFVPIVPELGLPDDVRFVFPHAPSMPVTINAGFVMPAWYDIYQMDDGVTPIDQRQDGDGVRASATRVADLLAREAARGVPPERTILAGFSQGGAIALFLGQRYPERLAGIVGLSTYHLLADSLPDEASEANRDTPVFMGHGTMDPVVRVVRGRQARDDLVAAGRDVQYEEYAMQHEVCMTEITDVGGWLKARLGL